MTQSFVIALARKLQYSTIFYQFTLTCLKYTVALPWYTSSTNKRG